MYRIGKEEIEAVARVIESGNLFRYHDPEEGEAARFEKELAEKLGAEYAVCVTSGTAALICGLVGLGIGPGDEVIVPGYTFMASAIAVLAVGAIPIVAEVDESLTLDPTDMSRKIGPRTRAVMPVHMCGLPCDMDAVMGIAERQRLSVLEDLCQADGGSYKGKRLGTIGHAGGMSFNFYKIMTSGEGGAVVTNDRVVYERVLIHHDGGCVFRPHAAEVGVDFFAGTNFRTNEIIAALLRVQLARLDEMLDRMRAQKRRFLETLSGHPKLRFIPYHDLEGDCGTTVFFGFDTEEEARAFAKALDEEGGGGSLPIDSGRHVYCNWEPVMEKQGSHHPFLDPFRMPENRGCRMDYTKDMCPQTLDVLARTVGTGLHPDWDDAEVDRRIGICERAAEKL